MQHVAFGHRGGCGCSKKCRDMIKWSATMVERASANVRSDARNRTTSPEGELNDVGQPQQRQQQVAAAAGSSSSW